MIPRQHIHVDEQWGAKHLLRQHRPCTDSRACPARQYLQAVAEALQPCGRGAAFYLAAAVSDFFIPWRDMVRVHGCHSRAPRCTSAKIDKQLQGAAKNVADINKCAE